MINRDVILAIKEAFPKAIVIRMSFDNLSKTGHFTVHHQQPELKTFGEGDIKVTVWGNWKNRCEKLEPYEVFVRLLDAVDADPETWKIMLEEPILKPEYISDDIVYVNLDDFTETFGTRIK